MMKKEELRLGNWVKIPAIAYYYDKDDFSEGHARITSLRRDELNTDSLKEISYDFIPENSLYTEFLGKK